MDNTKPNILFLSSWYPNRRASTFGIFVQRHAMSVSLYNNVAVLYACIDAELKSNTFEIEAKQNENIFEVIVYYKKVKNNIPFFSSAIKLFRYLKAYFKGYAHIQKHFGRKPDLLHLNVIFPVGIFALLLNYLYSIPLVISEHWSGYMPEDDNYKGSFMKWITSKCVSKAKSVMVISEQMKQSMLAHGLKNNYFIVPNVVDTKLFFPNKELRKQKTFTKIIHVSSINDREKNISGILKSIKTLSKNRDDFSLDVIGDGYERAFFEKLADDYKINNKFVFFKGFKTPKEVAQLMRSSDFFLMFSNYEGLPCVLLEALACGLPVIASRTGGIPSIITEENGILIEVKNENALVDALIKMIDTHHLYSSEKLSNYAAENFSYEKVGRQITEIYKQVLA